LNVSSVASGSVGIANGGYWGMKFENNTKYKVSFWAKKSLNFNGTIKVQLESNEGTVYAQSIDFTPGLNWQKFTCELTAKNVTKVSGNNRFVIYASSPGDVFFDVLTLMPPTWKNRPNGLRPDLAERMNALKFKYIQFPGGCTAESAHIDTCWNWKNSIGPIEERAGATRVGFGYKNDHFFGVDEYFQLCEDMGAEPIYTTSAGINERPDPNWWPSSVCPIDKMQPIIDDILDFLEYCNGSTSTYWGAKRAANGHPAPYNLQYIEIGNENSFMLKEYNERYPMIYKAVKAVYPTMKVMYNGKLSSPEMSHTYGNEVDFVDEHFYWPDLSTLYNRYDSIDPACKKICVAEYASSKNGNGGNVTGQLGDALNDAIFLLGCEKNSERMWWTGYGNYAGVVGHGDFGPNMIWNDAVTNFVTPTYLTTKMLFSDNLGTHVVPFYENTTSCFWSTSIDTNSKKKYVLLKVVNYKNVAESVKINLKGVVKVDANGLSTSITGSPEDENSIANPTKVAPKESHFKADRAFNYAFPASSVTVLRIRIEK
jgi:alpha-L-arabinofuranosidase